MENELLVSVMVGSDGYCGWVYYVVVDFDYCWKNWGRDFMCVVEYWLKEWGCCKIQLMICEGNDEVD